MEALLTDFWLGREGSIPIVDEASISVAREHTRELGKEHALPAEVSDKVVLVVSELARNQLRHAAGGMISLRVISRAGVQGLEVIAADRGPGIVDPAKALDADVRSSGSLGVGLASVCRMADEVDFDIRVGEGMCVTARKFAGDVPRRREVGVYGRPIAGERESGDAACFRRDEAGLTVGVCDGLGHGPLAREASNAAMSAFHDRAADKPLAILEAAHEALASTRGAVMAVARIDEDAGFVELASVGNIATHVYGVRTGRRFGGSSFVLGARQRVRKVQTELSPLGARELVVMCTDGIRSQLSLETELELQRERPIVIAHQIVERFAREGDDVLVLVAR